MALTKEDIRLLLSNEEPNYPSLARQITKSNLKDLMSIAKGNDAMLASKAIYLASLFNETEADDIVDYASKSKSVLKKIAAASAVTNLKMGSKKDLIAQRLLRADDLGIKKLVLSALKDGEKVSPRLKRTIENASRDKSKLIKDLSKGALKRIK